MPSSDRRPPVARLAPSPTGAQHLGNARTYLLGYWAARREGARIVLRIEDLDSPRVKSWAIDQAIEDLRWLGIDWDEGPDVGGPHQPYLQSDRGAKYEAAIRRLVERDAVYPCVCTRRDIAAAAGAPHADDQIGIYPGTCRDWRPGDDLPPPGTYCWRFRSRPTPVEFVDRVAGARRCRPGVDLGDFPVTRKTGAPAYQLAVVVDDAAMGVTDVVRGDDLLSSTFWQIELYETLGWQPPRFAHLPLVIGPDGRRLAKRHGDTRLSHFRQLGVRPETVVRWAAGSAGIPLSGAIAGRMSTPLESLHAAAIEAFAWERVPPEPIVVDRFP